MSAVEGIVGADKLLGVFGYWPSFHDAEVHWLRLDRRAGGESEQGPTLEALVHASEMTREIDASGYCVLRHHVLVRFRFQQVVDLRLEGFNYQNALMGLTILEQRDRQMERVRWSVSFESAFGVDATFQCYAIEVAEVVPCTKTGEPTTPGDGAASEAGRA